MILHNWYEQHHQHVHWAPPSLAIV